MALPRYLDARQVADLLSVSYDAALRIMRLAGATKIGRLLRIDEGTLAGYLAPAPIGVPAGGGVYFLRCAGRVKIGVTTNLIRRVATLKSGAPFDLQLLLVLQGGVEREREMHALWATDRIEREWFRLTPRLALFMASRQSEFQPPRKPTKRLPW